jgi:hypothetical protein
MTARDSGLEGTILRRRTFLRGMGAAVALPFLESLVPARALAAEALKPTVRRMAFIYVPNGAHMKAWTPERVGADFDLPPILEPLAGVKDKLSVLSGLTHDKGRANGDGPGDHARAAASFLTACQPLKTHGANLRAGVSVDQVAAEKLRGVTRFPSLELGCDRGQQSGNCDSGYSCAYSSNISWRSESTPMAKEINPRLVFDRLFGGDDARETGESRFLRARYRKSILDFVLEDARRLEPRLGTSDRKKLDEYLGSVREVEERIARVAREDEQRATGGVEPPGGIPKDHEEHIRLMLDMMVLAFQGDMTRVATFLISNEGSNRSYKFIDVAEGHHDLSHHGGSKDKQAKIQKINTFHVRQLAYFLEKLKAIPEAGGSVLDSSMVVYGSGISDGNRHNHDELPILLAGGGAGTLTPGRHIRYPRNTPVANLFLSMLDRMDASSDRLGDSSGRLPFLYGEDRAF